MENILNTYKQIIEAQKKGQLSGEQFIKLKELQIFTKQLNALEKEHREVVDYKMGI